VVVATLTGSPVRWQAAKKTPESSKPVRVGMATRQVKAKSAASMVMPNLYAGVARGAGD